MSPLDQKTVMITGAGKGLGRATALAFSRRRPPVPGLANSLGSGIDSPGVRSRTAVPGA
jgi:NAD(P)-dependent dehydrogenase (short-subunit alcohol dehydrogenase family)